jgi:lipoate-protein ligase A
MALDEALLADARDRHTLRLYWFAPPCLSIGAHQPIEEVDLAACAERGIEVVRRPSGGRAVLHDGEITYAIAGPGDGDAFAGGVLDSYRRIGAALTAACATLGLPVVSDGERRGVSGPSCFAAAAPYEPLAGVVKVAGSAQLRRGAVVLQHGSLRLGVPSVSIETLLRERRPGQRIPADPPPLSDLLHREVTRDEAAAALIAACATTFGVELVEAGLTRAELDATETLEERCG